MTNDQSTGLIGSIGLLFLMLLALWIIVRGLISNARPDAAGGSGRSPGTEKLGGSAANVLAVAMLYRYFFALINAGTVSFPFALGVAAILLAAMAFLPVIETLVGAAALFLFLTENVQSFGLGVVLGFGGMVVGFALLRKLFRR